MARQRERIRLEDGLKLDLNKLIRQKLVRPHDVSTATIVWQYRYSGEEIAVGTISADMRNEEQAWLRLQLGTLNQWIELEPVPRHFGGQQWYFLCPRTGSRVSILWKPPGGGRFLSRQAWGRQVAYGSQFETPHDRALSAAQEIRYQLGGPDYVSTLQSCPPKPKGMHQRTYDKNLRKINRHELLSFQYLDAFIQRLKR